VHGHCERARQWASASVDGELSTFERALLADHLERCASCREFSLAISDLTTALRAAPRERLEGSISIGRVRRHVRLRLAPAAAAMAVAAVGLGSVLASVEIKGGSVGSVQPVHAAPVAAPDTLNLSASYMLERLHSERPTASGRSLRGGPVVHQQ